MSEDTKIYIAVDFANENILLRATSKAKLNREILNLLDEQASQFGGAVWVYPVLKSTLNQIDYIMQREGKKFYEVTRPPRV